MPTKDERYKMMEDHASRVLSQPYSPHPDRHHLAVPTYLENWPAELQSLSIAQVDIPMTREEATALGSQIIELGEGFAPMPIPTPTLIAKVEAAFKKMPGPAFVRLGSRSPKDAFWDKDTFVVNDALEALSLLTASSERIYEDLRIGLHFGYEPHIFIREWMEIPEWAEFRCFMKDRKLIGISQYYHRKVQPMVVEEHDAIKWAIETFFENDFKDACHLNDVVFDVFVKVREPAKRYNSDSCGVPWRTWSVKLLEINPYWNLTDPCLFTWTQLENEWLHAELSNEFQPPFRYIKNTEDLLPDW
jgi:hypothetical protein